MHVKSNIKAFYRRVVFALSKNNPVFFGAMYRYFFYPDSRSFDGFANQFSKNNPGLTVIQIGANDGITQDPIHKYIRRDNWKGILLEPQKHVFDEFLYPLHLKNPHIQPLNAALSDKDGEQAIYRVAFSNARWATGLTSFRKEVLEEAIDTGHIQRCAEKDGTPLPDKKEDYIQEDVIEAISTETLLKRYSIDQVDWLQIDTEGFDFEIIKIFNVSVNSPRVIVYEHSHFTDSEHKACEDYLSDKGYLLKTFGGNTLAMLATETRYQSFFN